MRLASCALRSVMRSRWDWSCAVWKISTVSKSLAPLLYRTLALRTLSSRSASDCWLDGSRSASSVSFVNAVSTSPNACRATAP